MDYSMRQQAGAPRTGTGHAIDQSAEEGSGLTFTGRIASWSAGHRWWVIAASVMVLVLAIFVMKTVETKTLDYQGEGDSSIGYTLVDDRFQINSAPTEQLVFSNPSLGAQDPRFQATVAGLVQQLRSLPEVASVTSYYDTLDSDMLSRDGHVVLAQVLIEGNDEDAEENIDAILDTISAGAANASGFEIVMAGDTSIARQLEKIDEEDFSTMIVVTMVLALVLMLIAFRAVVAAILPLVLAIGSIFTALGVATVVSQVFSMVDGLAQIVLLIGMAVGVDYSLFIVSRYRSERKEGKQKLEAIAAASNTTGRAVFYAGVTVLLSMAGLILTNSAIFLSFSVGIMIVVFVALVASLTLLPAMLAVLGDNVNRLRLPIIGREGNNGGGIWGTITDKVLARPRTMATITAGALIALALPVLSLNLAWATGSDGLHDAVEGKRAVQLMEENFSAGLAQPAYVIVDDSDVNSAAVQGSVAGLIQKLEEDGAFAAPLRDQG